ncbi:M18 family aminopeptidase [Allobranchiibius huperziae]|uniref:M18 family aminopeptidase n=1 Tax=Allobranchiibius huperziae TaxID=1874116 RepID=A0A853DF04_9MICO|nr:aspartyl aminopeptidase [Allobranchiibius huperziae]
MPALTAADGLVDYLNASPSPFHACATTAARLTTAGFVQLHESDTWPTEPGRYLVVRGGSLVAWSTEHTAGAATAYRVVGAHTDSPNLRIKPRPDLARAGWQLLGVEVYGGPLVSSWLDRDLGLSGRVAVRDGSGVRAELFRDDDPVLRVSRLAIHLDRSVREGEQLNAQQHLAPHWGLGETPGDFQAYLAHQVGVDTADVLGWDAMTHDLQPARVFERERDLVVGARMDNLATCHAGTSALVTALEQPTDALVPVFAMFDHEEVGSVSERGAASVFLPVVLERITASLGGDRQDHLRALAGSVVASGDMAHGTHPHYADRHEPQHQIAVNGGPVLKINANLRYATDSMGAAAFRLACEQAGVPVQEFVTRSDLPCGSTVGPVTSAGTGVSTVDFGAATISMHSVRELVGAEDQQMYADALAAFLSPA